MAKAKKGDTVRIHFNGFLEDGSIFESSIAREPFEFTLGSGSVISGVEDAVCGMSEGETKTVTVAPENAYGYYDKKAVTVVEKTQIPPDVKPEIGMMLKARTAEGNVTLVTVKDLNEDTVTLDSNHPLAGKVLSFEIHLLEIS
jgi:peptidylprolyl isomerase